jgi:hypothetical protein
MSNPRKLRIWDIKAITTILASITQMQEKIETVLESMTDKETTLDQLPPSLVPTELLYDIAICYSAMYELLEKEQLIKSGNLAKSTKTLH